MKTLFMIPKSSPTTKTYYLTDFTDLLIHKQYYLLLIHSTCFQVNIMGNCSGSLLKIGPPPPVNMDETYQDMKTSLSECYDMAYDLQETFVRTNWNHCFTACYEFPWLKI